MNSIDDHSADSDGSAVVSSDTIEDSIDTNISLITDRLLVKIYCINALFSV